MDPHHQGLLMSLIATYCNMFVTYEPYSSSLGQSSILAPSHLQDTDPRACEDACLKGVLVQLFIFLQIVELGSLCHSFDPVDCDKMSLIDLM
jgi:hypothetical protein